MWWSSENAILRLLFSRWPLIYLGPQPSNDILIIYHSISDYQYILYSYIENYPLLFSSLHGSIVLYWYSYTFFFFYTFSSRFPILGKFIVLNICFASITESPSASSWMTEFLFLLLFIYWIIFEIFSLFILSFSTLELLYFWFLSMYFFSS